ncbi:uncharacterized protein LOC116843721 isoform X2 [Odontomachus brunneus]|uniref:uncharacterized protein LOC116843721 isoform X2 n=1 Tax=Odontomachus brunneus TaxID=486640 RepID=UPI0013F2A8CB|nr:uncharacterized protein LOC116843721 isoform X2 [Odontomachus brunneus]
MCNVLNEDTMTCDYGVSKVLSKDSSIQIMHSEQQQSVHRQQQQQNARKVGVMGSRRIFPPSFKLKVLHSYRNDMDCRGNQRATARKYGIHRRQIQKWLQCEESLKNCAENGNTRPASTSTTDSSASVSKSDSATETTGPAGPAAVAIPVAPALNLNVARLHGDELTTQQKSPPPASPPHLPRCSTSPSTRLRTVPKSVFLQSVGPVRYSQYSSPSDRKHLYRKAEDTVHKQEIYYMDTKMDRNRDHGDEPTTHVETTQLVLSGDRNEIVPHEDVRMYYWPSSAEHKYIVNDIDVSAHPQCQHQEHHHSPNHCPQNYGNVDLFNGHLYDLIGAPLIKTEPASPDSMATSGPYEPAGSPDDQWAPQSPTVSHQVANNSSGSSSSAHFNSAAGPSYVDVHVHERSHTHTFSSTPYPLSRLHQQERESEEMTSYTKEEGEQKEMLEHYKKVIKEEKEELFDVEVYDERQEDNKSPYIDVTGYTSMDSSSLGNAPIIAPEIELIDLEDQSPSSSDPANSGGSSSTSSDSEIEFIDCVADNQTSSDSIQTHRQQLRRSFPLRFKLSVLDAFHNDPDVAGNQRATARKFAINRRQVQKWLLKETELREEITLRGDSRQRLAPAREVFVESPIDLTVSQSASSDHSRPSSGTGLETEYEQSPKHCCETLTSQHRPYCPYIEVLTSAEAIESVQLSWILPCYADRHTTTSRTSSCQDLSLRGSHSESPNGLHCYSPKDYSEFYNNPEEPPPSSKRQASSWDNAPSPKRFCPDDTASRNTPTQQDRPLCLVKPKRAWLMASRMEALARSTRSELDASQPASTSATDDGILYKPYLDNPVCRPTSNYAYQRDPSPNTRQNIINNNNSRNTNGGVDENDIIHSPYTCSTNQDRPYFNPRMPCTWGLPLHPCAHATCNFQQTSDTFISFLTKREQREVMVSRMR